MKVLLFLIVAILAGPVGGYLLTIAGCGSGLFGEFCGHNAYVPLAGLTVVTWIAIFVWVAIRSPEPGLRGSKH